jgi:pyruvate/2-oxoglutarate dehydrogenase complex dihydrolipoamide dehydrogenase (E3) component
VAEILVKFDAIVIGSGQGGNPLCYALADLGWKVALVEKAQVGGTCINTGCTPTKTMIASAQVAYYARNAMRWGVRTGDISVDLAAVVARKNAVVQSFRGGNLRRIEARPNLRFLRGQARFVAPHSVQVESEILESERIFIDAGTRPEIPQLP